MKKILAVLIAASLALLASSACREKEAVAPADAPAGKAAAPSDEGPVSLDTESVMKPIREGDAGGILELLGRMTADRAGWAAGDFDDILRPLWNLFARQSGTEADPAGEEIQRRVSNLFNFGTWYPLLEDLLVVSGDRTAAPVVREAAAEHFWRFAFKAKAGQGFVLPASDRPRLEKAVLALLEDPSYALEATASQTAALLGMKTAVPRLKAIAGQAGEAAELRSLKYTAAEALYDLGEAKAGLNAMRGLAAGKGDFSEEAAEFLAKRGTK